MKQSKCMLPILMGLTLLLFGCSKGDTTPTNASPSPASRPHIELGRVFCLATQWYPQSQKIPDETENRLVREVVRQGVLMAAREELRLVTRDETLEEPFPKTTVTATAAAIGTNEHTLEPLSLSLEVKEDGAYEARLFGAGASRDNPVWQQRDKFDFGKRAMYAQLAAQMATACGTVAENLKAAGAIGKSAKLNPDNVPPAEVLEQLQKMNFVSQYAAVRAAHCAMVENGPSLPWIGVLVRGYAHLALLTDHNWSSQHEAFAARSLLYAERMMLLDPASRSAQWHRAYAQAIVGAHGYAIDNLAELDNSAKLDEQPLVWTAVVGPYVRFERDKLAEVAVGHPELKETVAFLKWHQYLCCMHGPWIYEKGLEATQVCPEAYGVYSWMASWPALVIQRTGASQGIRAFGNLLPARVAHLKELPSPVTALITSPPEGKASISGRPMKIARLLTAATRDEATPTECSWSILGGLIGEEQFVEAANLLSVSGDAVEHSEASLVERLLPLVDGHRYAEYIHSFSVPRSDSQQIAEMLKKLIVVDPRAHMRPLFERVWHSVSAEGRTGNEYSARAIWSRDFTQSGLLESWYRLASVVNSLKQDDRQKFVRDFREISPASPNALRLQWETLSNPDIAQLKSWESELKDDPFGWISMASAYYRVGQLADSARCYQKSLDISVSYSATEGLANCFYYQGDKDKWRSTLESYLHHEDLSLAHARVHELLADELIKDRKWKEAEPHALQSAQTYSATGLELASHLYEGMQDWNKSEEFVAETSRNYPTSFAGTDWYFWCRRTGRGDVASARPIAAKNIELQAGRTRIEFEVAQKIFVFQLLEGDPAAAIEEFEREIGKLSVSSPEGAWQKVWRLFHIIAVAGEMKNATRKKQAIADLRTVIEQEIKNGDPGWAETLDGLCRAFEGTPPDEAFLKKYDDTITKNSMTTRCDYSFLMGQALAQLGRTEQAELFWKRAAFGGPFDCLSATLAGNRLVKLHGPERGGLPPEFVNQEIKSNPSKKSGAEANVPASSKEAK
jgi:tetratricopeptide (TPR) repeat protein